jgi:hypothetical protein
MSRFETVNFPLGVENGRIPCPESAFSYFLRRDFEIRSLKVTTLLSLLLRPNIPIPCSEVNTSFHTLCVQMFKSAVLK